MAEVNIDALKKENEVLKKENSDLKQTNGELTAAIDKAAKDGSQIAVAVKGSYTGTVKDLEGEETKLKVEFEDGTAAIRIPKISGVNGMVGKLMPSELLFKLANGKPLSKEEKLHPAADSLTKERAQEILMYFAQVKASFVKTGKTKK